MEDEIRAAVEWWKGVLRRPPRHDNGEEMQSAFANVLAANLEPLPEEQVERFGVALADGLVGFVRPERNNYLAVDYAPKGILLEAAEKAGIEIGNLDLRFPFKTGMWIEPGRVTVSCGYRAPLERIYPARQ